MKKPAKPNPQKHTGTSMDEPTWLEASRQIYEAKDSFPVRSDDDEVEDDPTSIMAHPDHLDLSGVRPVDPTRLYSFTVPEFPTTPSTEPRDPVYVVALVVENCTPGDVICIGRKSKGRDQTYPYTAIAVDDDREFTTREIIRIFDVIREQGGSAHWKLNPYSKARIEKHNGGKIIPKHWDGKQLKLKKGTWVDDHISRFLFVSGDHDVGRSADEAKTWENALSLDEGLQSFWNRVLVYGWAPPPTYIQTSGRGFSPIWELAPPIVITDEIHRKAKREATRPGALEDVRNVNRQMYDRFPLIARDASAFKTVNPFIKAPGAVNPKAQPGRIATYAITDDAPRYALDDLIIFFAEHPLPQVVVPRRADEVYPDNPVKKRKRRTSATKSFARSLGPSRAFLRDLDRILAFWNWNIPKGSSNAFFRAYAWHRHNVLRSEIYAEAKKVADGQIDESEVGREAHRALLADLVALNEKTGKRRRMDDLRSYATERFGDTPQATSTWAQELGVTRGVYEKLKLETIIPETVKDEITEAAARKRYRREVAEQKKWKEIDEILINGLSYDPKYSKNQYAGRRKRLEEQGFIIPRRRAGRPKKVKFEK